LNIINIKSISVGLLAFHLLLSPAIIPIGDSFVGTASAVTDQDLTAATGDMVTVNYLGKLEDGRVFDTSLLSVAYNTSVAKSLGFTLRSNSSYVPFSLTIGAGTVISGFNDGIIGMKVGDEKVITIPPSKGYGEMDLSKVFSFDLNETKTIYENMTFSEFKTKFGVTAVYGLSVQDPTYNWPVLVIYANMDADKVRIQNAPMAGQQIDVYKNATVSATGWNITIQSVDSTKNAGEGEISLHHNVTALDNRYIMGYDSVKKSTFILDDVSTSTPVWTGARNYNTELIGKNLVFTVKLVSIVS
jgi:FKBP-type peptidyl-prolyl cis-trans isomerase 2